MTLVLDCGSGNTCKNDRTIVRRMIEEVVRVDTHKHKVVFKWQLFTSAPPNEPLNLEVFYEAHDLAREAGYECTASVFDKESLAELLAVPVPFVKIACRPALYPLIGEVPRRIPVWVSVRDPEKPPPEYLDDLVIPILCQAQYPANYSFYKRRLNISPWVPGVSDHTVGFEVLKLLVSLKKKFCVPPNSYSWEKHYKLPDSTGPDAGPFAVTAEDLKEIM